MSEDSLVTPIPPTDSPPLHNGSYGEGLSQHDPDTAAAATDAAPIPARTFVVPTGDGGEVVIREPQKIVMSGGRERRLRELTSSEKATRRSIKNAIVFSIFAMILAYVFWALLP